jgi:SAM-dependent methyltransferase
MAHSQQLKFIQLVNQYFFADDDSQHLHKKKILEIGSYDVNGSIRQILQNEQTEYIGVDLCEGKGVDLVSYGHDLTFADESFDVTISSECFEHDPNWVATFSNMCRMTKSCGVVIFTCATLGRIEHGTQRTHAEHSPGTQFIGLNYYKNLTQQDFVAAIDIAGIFSEHYFFIEKSSYDLYFVGIKAGGTNRSKQIKAFCAEVANIKKIGRFRFKPIEFPVIVARKTLKETTFQDFACAYLQKVYPLRSAIKRLSRTIKK